MKFIFNRIVLALLAGTAMASSSWAQSTVTLSGRVVGGVEYIDKIQDKATGDTYALKRVADNQWGTSMLTFAGSDDLGGGLKGYFTLEGGFSSKDGSFGSALFNRRAFVGISSTSWGSLQFGRNLQVINDVWYIDPTGQQNMGSATLVRERSWPIVSNVIEYSTPNWSGFGGTAQIGLGEKQDSFKKGTSSGISLYYVGDALEARAMFSRIYDADGKLSNVYAASDETIISAAYKFGPARVFAAYDYISAPDAAADAPSKLKHGWLGVRYDATPQMTLIAAAYHINADRVDGKATLLVLGTEYNLSKRTFLYASIGGVDNSSEANFKADVGAPDGPGAGNQQKVFYAGFGHNF